MQLRPYQQEAVDAALADVARGEHPVLALPTASGKSLVIAELCRRLPGRVLVATHRQELLSQNCEELLKLLPTASVGIYSAGLDRRETCPRLIFGGVQSIYPRMDALQAAGTFEAIMIDEVHLCQPRMASASMYAQVFAACPTASRIGLSATPFRLDGGVVYGKPESWFTTLAYEVGIRALTPEYLAPLRGLLTAHEVDVSGVHIRQGEYVTSELSQAASAEAIVEGALDELCQVAANRRSWMLFGVDVAHTELLAGRLRARGIPCGTLFGHTPQEDRRQVLDDFRSGRMRALANCLVGTTGFNLPQVDCIALFRPTMSRGLLIQQLGRGCRQAPGKADCLILDFAHNLERHAPLDALPDELEATPARQAKEAQARAAAEARRRALASRHAGVLSRAQAAAARRQAMDARHGAQASRLDPFDEPRADAPAPQTYPVRRVVYGLAASKKFAGKTNLRVSYYLHGLARPVQKWLCLEYETGAKWYARQWFACRGVPMPRTAHDAYGQSQRQAYPVPTSVRVVQEGTYPSIAMEYFQEDEDDRPLFDDE